jgi:hypothetical protein
MRGLLAGTAVAVLASTVPAAAQTSVNGNIITDTDWTVEGSPYVIERSTVLVTGGATLTIHPGVDVRFQAGRSLESDATSPYGAIVAVGAPGDSITFTSNASTPSPGAWGAVRINASGAVLASDFTHCIFRYASQGLQVAGGAEPRIQRCLFEHCATGIFLSNSAPDITECTLTRCNYAIYLIGNGSTPVIYHCNLVENAMYSVYTAGFTQARTVVAEFNWWGTTDEVAIGHSIFDVGDSGGSDVTVDFRPYLDQVPVARCSWGRIKDLFSR